MKLLSGTRQTILNSLSKQQLLRFLSQTLKKRSALEKMHSLFGFW